jgi:hypothetical protein
MKRANKKTQTDLERAGYDSLTYSMQALIKGEEEICS